MITISAFKWVPDFAQGQVRDLRARWALEEAGLPYKTRLLEQGDQDKPDYRALQPFGQVPILEEDGFVLFESGAIVLYIGERTDALLPKDVGARARATQWLIAALNSIEPFVMNVALIDLFYANEEWGKLRRPGAVEFVQKRLSALSKSLGDKPYLDGDRFTAGDLMMTTVLRILKHTDIVTSDKRLAAYIERCTARPAFKRAFDAQIGISKRLHNWRKAHPRADGSEIAPTSKPQPHGALVKALARAWRWQRILDEGVYTSVSEIGDAETISKSYVSRILRLALLAPDVVVIRRSCWSTWSGRCRRAGRNSGA